MHRQHLGRLALLVVAFGVAACGGDGTSAGTQSNDATSNGDTTNHQVPSAWSCDSGFYGTNDGCDCGCGVLDTDCDSMSAEACDLTFCGSGLTLAVDDNTACVELVCGDGVIVGLEACDDGNTDDGDGCSADCHVELGWSCDDSDPPSTCERPIPDWNCDVALYRDGFFCDCGCGVLDPDCPDSLASSCYFPTGCVPAGTERWSDVTTVPDATNNASCVPNQCGDGFLADTDRCDDGNTDDGDGCSDDCQVEPAWACVIPEQRPPMAQVCVEVSCEGACGGAFMDICFCAPSCVEAGDCCHDYEAVCN